METRTALVGVVALAAVLATVGAAGVVAAGGQAQSQTEAQTGKTIQVSAAGQVQTQADRAIIRVAVVATGDDIESVREQLASNASSMKSALAEMGIDGAQVQTAHYDISSNKRYGGSEGEEPTYQAVHGFVVTVNDTSRVGAVIDTAVNNGASEIDGVQFTLSAEKRSELKQQALQQAMDSARSKASAVATRADLTIAGVKTIQTSRYSTSPYQAEAVALAADSGTDIDSGPVTVTASVNVVYEAQSGS